LIQTLRIDCLHESFPQFQFLTLILTLSIYICAFYETFDCVSGRILLFFRNWLHYIKFVKVLGVMFFLRLNRFHQQNVVFRQFVKRQRKRVCYSNLHYYKSTWNPSRVIFIIWREGRILNLLNIYFRSWATICFYVSISIAAVE
jgi:hypothetical protein